MRKGIYDLSTLPRFSEGIPHIRSLGWLPEHMHYHQNRTIDRLFICFTLKTEPGECISIINGERQEKPAVAPHVSFVRPGTVMHTLQTVRHDELFFSYPAESYAAFWRNYFPLERSGFKRTDAFNRLLDRVLEALNELHTPGQADALDALVPQLLAEVRIQEQCREESREEEVVRKIASHLTGRFAERIDIPALLHGCGLSQRSFYRLWNRLYAESPLAMLQAKRMFAAEHLLATTDLRIQEVADLCGFSSAVYFYQSFRKLHRCSPAEFRKQNRGNGP